MSKAQHTPGPLTYDGFDLVGADKERFVIMGQGISLGSRATWPQAEPNWNRFVACWNACEGISTEALEGGETIKIHRDAERYRWLRDRLAIEDVERLEHEFLGYADEEESIKTDKAVDAALAKAKGE